MNWQEIKEIILTTCLDLAWKIVGAVLVLVVGKLIIKFVLAHFPRGSKKHPLEPTLRIFLMSATKFLIYTLIIITVVQILGAPLASVITVVGAVGATIALALQGSLANLANGFMILIFKPLKIGDFIEVSSSLGTVIDLDLFYTTLRTVDNRHIILPNSALTNTTIINYSMEKTRPLEIVFPVDRDTNYETARSVIYETVSTHEFVLDDPAPFVRMTEISNSSLNFTVRVWCLSENFWALKFDLTENVKAELDKNGINIPLPQLDVHIKH